MADTVPQPGDGAYLARPIQVSQATASTQQQSQPQPGDGAYLAQRSNKPRRKPRPKAQNDSSAANGSNGAAEVASQMSSMTIDENNRHRNEQRQRGGGDKRPGRGKSNQQRRNAAADHERSVRDNREHGVGIETSAAGTALNAGASVFKPGNGTTSSGPSRSSSHDRSGNRSQRSRKPREPKSQQQTSEAPPKPVSNRRAAFERGSKLTTTTSTAAPKKEPRVHVPSAPEADDLNSRLTRGLRGKPFIECPICFNPIFSQQQTWSCLPPHAPPKFPPTMEDNERPAFIQSHYTACYTPFHIQCVRDWASRSLNEDTERIRKMELPDDPSWRCPGCQKRRQDKIGGYRCFCGRLANPPNTPTAPHSCNDACSRVRPNCSHPCPLDCHPGPCPPCQVALVVRCPSHGTSLTVKCSTASTNDAALTPVCDETCLRQRNCGKHDCDQLCHFGPCAPCDEVETVRCYCGDEEKVVPCGWEPSAKKHCASESESWIGRFACDRVCRKTYECGIHQCQETCHPHPLSPVPCPSSPSVIKTCPCGATPLEALPNFPRPDCLAPIPTCGGECPKSRPCGHPCPLKCHSGDCPPCHEQVYRPCRCGESTLLLDCDEVRERQAIGEDEFFCERVCKALRNCGRHECGRICCPLSYKAKRKGRRGIEDHDQDDLHVCPLICGKQLSCGRHTCPRPDHKGACGRCLQASYDELICNCGHTVIYPPVACGTAINCVFPCARPPPSCGHPKTPHNCHENSDCPPCPFLTTKPCACGKDPAVKNIRCSQTQDRVSCGTVCGKLLGCGYHRCEKTCHSGECESCTQTCNKPKRICKHPCSATCHAPAKCPESEPCTTQIVQTCACGNIQVRNSCGASTSNPVSRESTQLKCNSECMQRQRNARLADALGIKSPVDRTQADWPADLRSFASANAGFIKTVEETFKDFINGARQTMILPHMPATKRTFVIAMADMYRLGRELIDAEPNRSVQIRRRVDTRIPTPLLSAAAAPRLGALGNLRAPTASTWTQRSSATSAAAAASPAASAPTSRVASPQPGQIRAATSANTPQLRSSALSNTSTPARTPVAGALPLPVAPVTTEVGVVGDTDWDQSGDEA